MTRIDQPWLTAPETQAVCRALTANGAQALFVGGCVRNALMDAGATDLDIATDAEPGVVMELASAAGLKATPTGFDHGTITIVSGNVAHEVTTFRKDIATDGRRAVVAYSKEIAEDAARRDFTMNALYARPDGTVVDPLGGLPDLLARRVRFIGDAEQRIREDYLRSLRYFRFFAWYGDVDHGFDPDALAAIAATLDGLGTLSKERVGAEVLKLLSAPDPSPAVAGMRQTGVLNAVLPGADDRALGVLVHLENGADPDPLRRLAVLGGEDTADLLRLSKKQAAALDLIRTGMSGMNAPAELSYRHGRDMALNIVLARSAALEQPVPDALEQALTNGEAAQFPVSAADLMPRYSGPELGRVLRKLEADWIASDFALDRDALLRKLI